MQVQVRVTLERFVHALNFARRNDERVRASLMDEGEVALKVANEFRRLNPAPTVKVLAAMREKEHQFYSKHCHLYLCMDGNEVRGGYCVLSGELLCLWNHDRSTGDWMLRHALELGADRLDHFDLPPLNDLYHRHGFKEIFREPNWVPGKPDVIWRRKQ